MPTEKRRKAATAFDAIHATPIALAQLANQSAWALDHIVVDEAGGTTETFAAFPVCNYPNAVCMTTGDV